MFDKLFDFLASIYEELLPCVVLPPYLKGVRLRWGISKGILEPGFHWKIPFADNILSAMVKPTAIPLPEQSVTTADGLNVVVKATVKYQVDDVEKLLLDVNKPIDAFGDMIAGIIRSKIIVRTWAECNGEDLMKQIASASKREGKRWGIEIMEVTLTDLAIMRSLRLLYSGQSPLMLD